MDMNFGIGGGSAQDDAPRSAPGHDRVVRPLSAPETSEQGWWKSARGARKEWFEKWARRHRIALAAGVIAVASALIALALDVNARHDEAQWQESLAEIEARTVDSNYVTSEGVTVNAMRGIIAPPDDRQVVYAARTSGNDDELENFFGDAESIVLDDFDPFPVCDQ